MELVDFGKTFVKFPLADLVKSFAYLKNMTFTVRHKYICREFKLQGDVGDKVSCSLFSPDGEV